MKSRNKTNPKKRIKINFAEQNSINEKGKENYKNESNISTYASNNYSVSINNSNKKKLFLDYTFQENKYKLYNHLHNNENITSKLKAKNYYFELKKTFVLNLEMLLFFYHNKKEEQKENIYEEDNEILKLLNSIRKKEIKRNEIKLLIKQKCTNLIKKHENLYSFYKKYQTQINIYNIKINNKLNGINQLDTYISILKSRFSGVDIYINKLRFISEGKKGLKHSKHKLVNCIQKNNKNLLKIRDDNHNIKKLKSEISELKKDNKLSKRQNKLFKVKNPNINLIRVVEFYIRIIRTISLKNKILKNSINSLCKTLEFLDLNQIKDFTEYKRTRQKSSYEIEFSDLENNYYEENKDNNLEEKKEIIKVNLKNFMDFNKILNI